MEATCPFCHADFDVPSDIDQAECEECHRQFPVNGKPTVTCPNCHTDLPVPKMANVILCGTCGQCVVVRSSASAGHNGAAGDLLAEPMVADAETSLFEPPEDFEQTRLDAIREEFAGKYEILQLLGYGGMGALYKARQKKPERLVVLKLMLHGRFASEKYRMRFAREAQAVARLKHPGIVSVYEFGEVNGQPYFTMEYVEGSNIKEYALGRSLEKEEICQIILKVCRAVAYAHQRGVIHRDIKPSNILVDGTGNPRLLDFGLARLNSEHVPEGINMTEAGEVMGTPSYMSPEQTLGRPEEIDMRSDVYSIGVLFYELLTAQLPYQVDHAHSLESLHTIREAVPPRLSDIQPRVDNDLDAIVLKCLEKHRDMRYQSAVEVAEDISRYLRGQPVEARPATSLYHLRKLTWRHRNVFVPLAVAAVLVIALTAAFMAYMIRQKRQAETGMAAAQQEKQEIIQFLGELKAVRTGVDNLLAQGRWSEAYSAAAFAEKHLPEDAGLAGYTDLVGGRIGNATAGEPEQIALLIEDLHFDDARSRMTQLRDLAETVGLPELAAQLKDLADGFDEACWRSAMRYMQRNGGSVWVLEKFLAECSTSANAEFAKSMLREKRTSIRYTEWPFDAAEAARRQTETVGTMGIKARQSVSLGADLALDLMLVPAGEFMMGAAEAEGFSADQNPPHRVRITEPFYLGTTETTRAQFEAVTGRTLAPPEGYEDADAVGDLPAAVSWQEAHLFCTELSRRTQLTFRLPTEAEWEYACRAGCKNVYGEAEDGDRLPDCAWYVDNAEGKPHPVGQKQPNAWGLSDMRGNVQEWCEDWYDSRYYFSSPVDNPTGPNKGRYKALRGGSWADDAAELQAAYRKAAEPEGARPMYGFRVRVDLFMEETRPTVRTPLLSSVVR